MFSFGQLKLQLLPAGMQSWRSSVFLRCFYIFLVFYFGRDSPKVLSLSPSLTHICTMLQAFTHEASGLQVVFATVEPDQSETAAVESMC